MTRERPVRVPSTLCPAPEWPWYLPVRSYRSDAVVGHALVDADSLADLCGYTWRLTREGYVTRGGGIRLHRVVLGLRHGDARHADHRDLNRMDNRRSNLRLSTAAENAQNVPARGGASRFRGVTYRTNERRWYAQVQVNRQTVLCRGFASEVEAAIAAEAARRTHMPFAQPDPALIEALGEAA